MYNYHDFHCPNTASKLDTQKTVQTKGFRKKLRSQNIAFLSFPSTSTQHIQIILREEKWISKLFPLTLTKRIGFKIICISSFHPAFWAEWAILAVFYNRSEKTSSTLSSCWSRRIDSISNLLVFFTNRRIFFHLNCRISGRLISGVPNGTYVFHYCVYCKALCERWKEKSSGFVFLNSHQWGVHSVANEVVGSCRTRLLRIIFYQVVGCKFLIISCYVYYQCCRSDVVIGLSAYDRHRA